VGDHANVALVIGQEDASRNDVQLEHAARLYKYGEFRMIILCVPGSFPTYGAQASMRTYLEQQHVPSDAIFEDSGAADSGEMAHDVAQLMKEQDFGTVMIISDYYRMSRIKLALLHAGVSSIAKSHVGVAKFQDAAPIAWEVCALYEYLFRTFVLPATEQLKHEASDAAGKATQQAEKARDSLKKNLDTLPK
jgi:uncharacterized SAM-binding protein YcdF (DUF218 family)